MTVGLGYPYYLDVTRTHEDHLAVMSTQPHHAPVHSSLDDSFNKGVLAFLNYRHAAVEDPASDWEVQPPWWLYASSKSHQYVYAIFLKYINGSRRVGCFDRRFINFISAYLQGYVTFLRPLWPADYWAACHASDSRTP